MILWVLNPKIAVFCKFANYLLLSDGESIETACGRNSDLRLSTILARIVNFLLVPLYTRVLVQSDYGVVTEFMAYIAILQVVLVLGLETVFPLCQQGRGG